jgi:hypothetical protein
MDNWKIKLKKQWDENPLLVVSVGAFSVTAVAKLVDALSAAQGRRAYARQVDYRVNRPLPR